MTTRRQGRDRHRRRLGIRRGHRQALRARRRARGRQRHRTSRSGRRVADEHRAPPAAARASASATSSKRRRRGGAGRRSRSTRSASSTSSSTTPGTTHRNQPMLDVAEDEFDRIYAVNVKSLYLTARHAVPHFRKQRSGVFITIASTAGVRPRPGLTWYNGSKGAAIVTSRSMAAELGAATTSASTSSTRSQARPRCSPTSWARTRPRSARQFLATIPLGRLSQPADIATAAVFSRLRRSERSSPAHASKSTADAACSFRQAGGASARIVRTCASSARGL